MQSPPNSLPGPREPDHKVALSSHDVSWWQRGSASVALYPSFGVRPGQGREPEAGVPRRGGAWRSERGRLRTRPSADNKASPAVPQSWGQRPVRTLTCALPGVDLHFRKHSQLYRDLRLALPTAKAIEERGSKPSSPLLLGQASRTTHPPPVRPIKRTCWLHCTPKSKPVPVSKLQETSLPACNLTLIFSRSMSLLETLLWPVNGSHRLAGRSYRDKCVYK